MIVRVMAAAALCALTACSDNSSSQTTGPVSRLTTPAEDFHFIPGGFSRGRGPDGNTMIYNAPDGLLVIDTGRHPGHSQLILDYAAAEGVPITKIINTHWHLDHATGNQDIKAVYPDAKVYTTRAVEGALTGFLANGLTRSAELLQDPNISDKDRAELERGRKTIIERVGLLPDVVVDGPMKLAVNGREIELEVTDHAVTESDVWIWDPATRTAIVGDIVTLPAPFFDTACPSGWLAAFVEIETKPYERVIPGHGDAMTADEFRAYRRAVENLVSCAADKTGAECAEAWVADAGALIDKAAGDDEADRRYARAAAEYYVDEIIKSDAKRAEFCPASFDAPQ